MITVVTAMVAVAAAELCDAALVLALVLALVPVPVPVPVPEPESMLKEPARTQA
jgi:hypothetical protein